MFWQVGLHKYFSCNLFSFNDDALKSTFLVTYKTERARAEERMQEGRCKKETKRQIGREKGER
jgi:hypothetical protein